jgi:sarcosine oxidase subunit gamma
LRCREGDIDKASTILGLSLPRAACRSASADGLHALWLGPDEWLVLAAGSAAETMLQASERLAALGGACVDVSHRQVAITLDGPEAEIWLASGCPLDLAISAFPAGACSRTVFDKAEIILGRTGPESFHLEVWRSFAPYVEALLSEATLEEPTGSRN